MDDKLKEFTEDLKALFEKHQVLAGYLSIARANADIKGLDWSTKGINTRSYDFNFMEFFTDKVPEYAGDLDELKNEVTINQQRDFATVSAVMCNHVILELIERDKKAKRNLGILDQLLGINTARCLPLTANTPYIIFTTIGAFSAVYGDDELWVLERVDGEEHPPEGSLHFIGNVQGNGEIFHSGNLPIVSTGDRMLFGTPTDESNPSFISSHVTNAVERQNLN